LSKVNCGTHPYALKGKSVKSTSALILSVPVGRSYRLLYDEPTLAPLRIVSHASHAEISAVDVPYIIDVRSCTTEEWEERGPLLAMLAQKVVDSKITMRDLQLAKFV
jgi:hypothetical protein